MKPIPSLPNSEWQADPEAGFGTLSTPRGNLPLKSVEVRTRIDGLLYRTLVRQTFANGFNEPLEATYIFPLPDRAAASRFRLKVGDRLVEGELRERQQARQAYEDALAKGHRAAIAEEERPNVFTMRVGNLPPGESASVELTLTGTLAVDAGEATYRFPLVVAPRYIPGTPLPGECVGDGTELDTDAVPDASRISPPILLPGFPNAVQLDLSVEVHPGSLPIRDFRSTLPTVEEGATESQLKRFRLQPGPRMDRDFVLRFCIADDGIRTGLQCQPDENDPSTGTFALTIVPPKDSGLQQKPRDVVFVLDRSGSMNGWKMVAARRALGRMIDSLTAQDRFAVLAFDDHIEAYPETGLSDAADRQRFRALEFLAKIESRGGTELAAPLAQAIKLLPREGREAVLVLLTDGQVGNEDQILSGLANKLKGIRIFTLGIDQAVNEAFLRRLAGLGGGYTEVVESEDRLDEVMSKIHRRIASPVLHSLHIESAGLRFDPKALVPGHLPDLFPGAPLMILGRYEGAAAAQTGGLSILAKDETGEPWTAKVQATPSEVASTVWARGFIRALEDRYVAQPLQQKGLEKEIVATSLRFKVLCRFTAFVAVDVTEVVNESGHVKRVTQPVEPAAGWKMLDIPMTGFAATRSLRAFAAPSGALGKFREAPPAAAAPMAFPEVECLCKAPAEEEPGHIDAKLEAPAEDPLDLTAYKVRAVRLLAIFDKSSDPVKKFKMLAMKLEELLEDLKSIDTPQKERKPLEDLLQALRDYLKRGLETSDTGQMEASCKDLLRDFVTGKRSSRWAFWK